MGKFILADNQELTRLALISLIKQDEDNTLYVATDRAGLVELLKEHEDATVLLDFTLFDFADAEQLLIIIPPISSASSSRTDRSARCARPCRPSPATSVTSVSAL